MYELICGSIFDKKCDMIIIPCNNYSGVSPSIRKDILLNDIPYFINELEPGQVIIKENNGSFTNASVIGYAASVNSDKLSGLGSDEKYLDQICKTIISYCENNSLQIVNIPLLGTGAGGLDPKQSFHILKTNFESHSKIYLRIFALTQEIYTLLQENESKKPKQSIKIPRVFISYTGENPDNKQWVYNFACRLRKNGVDAHLDIFHLKPGYSLPQWMTNEIVMADKILLICDKDYSIKADTKKGGVGWETMIIQGDMLTNVLSNKYICIVREKDFDKGLPIYVKSNYAFHWCEDSIPEEEFKQLIMNLYDCEDAAIPEVEAPPDYIINASLLTGK